MAEKAKRPRPGASAEAASAIASGDATVLDELDETLIAGPPLTTTEDTSSEGTEADEPEADEPDSTRLDPEVVRVEHDEPADGAESEDPETEGPEEDQVHAEDTSGAPDDADEGDTDAGDADETATSPDAANAAEAAAKKGGMKEESVEELKQRITQLSDAMDSMQSDRDSLRSVSEQFSNMQENLKSLQHLSELLSLRYNPFLEGSEEAIFDGDRNDPQALIQRLQSSGRPLVGDASGPGARAALAPPGAAAAPTTVPAVPAPEGPAPGADPASPAAAAAPAPAVPEQGSSRIVALETGDPEADGQDAADEEPPEEASERGTARPQVLRGPDAEADLDPETEPPRGPRQRPPPRTRPVHETPLAVPPRRAGLDESGGLYVPPSRLASFGVRETFLVMTWFEHIIGKKDPGVLYAYLDYYEEVGWLSDEAYTWMLQLAQGITTRPADATWAAFGLKPKELIKTHMASLRFFDFLFRINLDRTEEKDLQKRLSSILEDGG